MTVFPINHQMGGRKPSSEALSPFLEPGWMPLCKEFIVAEDSRHTITQYVITYSLTQSMSLLTRTKLNYSMVLRAFIIKHTLTITGFQQHFNVACKHRQSQG